MKIIYYSSHPNLNLAAPSGPGTHMREVIKGFEARGHQVVPVIMGGTELELKGPDAPSQQPTLKQKLKKLLPDVVWQTLKDFNLLRFDKFAQQTLEEAIEAEKPDLIYERGYYLMESGIKAAKKHGVRHFIEINAPYPEEKVYMEGKSLYLQRGNNAEKKQAQQTDTVVVVSSALRDYLVKRTGIFSEKVLITPNAVNRSAFDDKLDSMIARKDLGYDAEDIVVGFVGSIFPYHGVDHLVKAFDQSAKKEERLRLHIVGDGETLASIKQIASSLDSRDKITFTGKLHPSEVSHHIAAMDIGVMPRSNWYGSPVKIFEYGAMNLAVIGPDNGPMKDVIENGINGILIGDHVEDLSRAIDELASNEQLRDSIARKFQEQVFQQHTWQSVSDSILSRCSIA